MNLCDFAGIVVDREKSVFKEEPEYLETEYRIAQNEFGAVAWMDEYPKEGVYPLSDPSKVEKEGMMKFYIDRDVVQAEGTQTFCVEAETEAEAREKFIAGKGDISSNDVEVMRLGPWDWDTLYSD